MWIGISAGEKFKIAQNLQAKLKRRVRYRLGKFVSHVTRTKLHLSPQTDVCVRPLIKRRMQVSVLSSKRSCISPSKL